MISSDRLVIGEEIVPHLLKKRIEPVGYWNPEYMPIVRSGTKLPLPPQQSPIVYRREYTLQEYRDIAKPKVHDPRGLKDSFKSFSLTEKELLTLGDLNPEMLKLLMQQNQSKDSVKKKKTGIFSKLVSDKVESVDPTEEEIAEWEQNESALKNWGEQRLDDVDSEYRYMIDEEIISEGWYIEYGEDNPNLSLEIMLKERDVTFYNDYLYGRELIQYIVIKPDGDWDRKLGPIVISLEKKPSNNLNMVRCLVRDKLKYRKLWLPVSNSYTKTLKAKIPDLENLKFIKLNAELGNQLSDQLSNMEQRELFKFYKFGVLYAKEGQTDENDMFSNLAEDASEDYHEFLEFLGERITLEGYEGYRGGLDVKTNSTGLESIHTEIQNYDIMFHVSTMLPSQQNDLQRVERKRHLGNDVVMIIFREGDVPFDPRIIHTQFIHIFYVIDKVYPLAEDGITRYRLTVATKTGLKMHYPTLKKEPVYEKNEEFRQFLLTKCINSERVAMASPEFDQRIMRTRKEMLLYLINDLNLL